MRRRVAKEKAVERRNRKKGELRGQGEKFIGKCKKKR